MATVIVTDVSFVLMFCLLFVPLVILCSVSWLTYTLSCCATVNDIDFIVAMLLVAVIVMCILTVSLDEICN